MKTHWSVSSGRARNAVSACGMRKNRQRHAHGGGLFGAEVGMDSEDASKSTLRTPRSCTNKRNTPTPRTRARWRSAMRSSAA